MDDMASVHDKKTVRKAVIAAAGFGTRFLPQTKAMPKEMLPLVDKPIIQYVVEELVEAGIEDIIIVTGFSKRAIEDHFDRPSLELINNLKANGKEELISEVESIAGLANFIYIRQKGPVGNAAPILDAEHLIGNEPFIYAYADDFVWATPSRFKQLLNVHDERGGSILTCVRLTSERDYKHYGYAGGKAVSDGVIEVNAVVEKPGSAEASPSDLATVSGYVLDPAIFAYLHEQRKSLQAGQEFVVQQSMQKMIEDGRKLYGVEVKNGKFYDAGSKLEYLKTVVDFALMNESLKRDFKQFLLDKISETK